MDSTHQQEHGPVGKTGDDTRQGNELPSADQEITALSTDTNQHQPPHSFLIDQDGRKLFRSACLARQISPDHTSETAYLVIPEDAVHGYLLKCSHALCAESGIRFRYCVVCARAVTRRNFCKRHHHGLIKYDEDGGPILPPSSGVSDSEVVNVVVGSSLHSLCQPTIKLPQPPSKRLRSNIEGETKPAANVGVAGNPAVASAGIAPLEHGDRRPEEFTSPLGDGLVSSSESEDSCSDEESRKRRGLHKQEEAWLLYYRERPQRDSQNRAAIAKWLATLLETSYPRSFQRKRANRGGATRGATQKLDSSREHDLMGSPSLDLHASQEQRETRRTLDSSSDKEHMEAWYLQPFRVQRAAGVAAREQRNYPGKEGKKASLPQQHFHEQRAAAGSRTARSTELLDCSDKQMSAENNAFKADFNRDLGCKGD